MRLEQPKRMALAARRASQPKQITTLVRERLTSAERRGFFYFHFGGNGSDFNGAHAPCTYS